MNRSIFLKPSLPKLFFIGIVTFSFLVLNGCDGSDSGSSQPSRDEKKETSKPKNVKIPRFNRDSAYVYTEKQVAFGPRVPGTEEHVNCKNWLVKKLSSFGANVIEQEFKAELYTGESPQAFNIIGQINPNHPKRIILAAHWDSRFMADQDQDEDRKKDAILGADDGASGVGVLLEIARNLSETPIDMGVDIIFFDAEDQGFDAQTIEESQPESWCLGAQYWARNLHVKGYKAKYGILLDMVGAEDARFIKEGYSMQFAPRLVNKVWKLAKEMGYGNYFVNQQDQGGVTDDHVFVSTIARIPMIDIINRPAGTQTGFGSYWHTHDDDMDVISKRTLRAVGQVVMAAVYNESIDAL